MHVRVDRTTDSFRKSLVSAAMEKQRQQGRRAAGHLNVLYEHKPPVSETWLPKRHRRMTDRQRGLHERLDMPEATLTRTDLTELG